METNIEKYLHLGVAVRGAVHITRGIKFAQQTEQPSPLSENAGKNISFEV